ncbi:glycerol-3-phosphate 1-O-acyltransferase PlsY [uncultured Enorma sp.]|uniref:glycerol-3-phosphate 1-O-acyltransferase PlsY n=1 Tax=uncultured Enorma sp. TaxID=1714346 RepID=UPI002621648A|nr:glycerol-3-phosphate 1-O-acyltransferase PlsY [uncultured Enorma sp.]
MYAVNTAVYATLGMMLVSYLICGIPFGKILAKAMSHKDLQHEGSGNIGTTNALRVAGPKVAAITLACDLLKGTICMRVAMTILWDIPWASEVDVQLMVAFIALACLYGHIFSPYLHFHGGKGIATGVGILFGFFWPLAIIHLAIFIVLVAITKYVSVGSIVTAALVPLTVSILVPYLPPAVIAVWAVLGWSVVAAHHANIGRLRAGTESKISFGSKKEDA